MCLPLLAGVRGRGERGAAKAGGKGKHPVQHAEDTTTEHDFLGCMSRWVEFPSATLALITEIDPNSFKKKEEKNQN